MDTLGSTILGIRLTGIVPSWEEASWSRPSQLPAWRLSFSSPLERPQALLIWPSLPSFGADVCVCVKERLACETCS